MANAAGVIPKPAKRSKTADVPWLARLTHPLVFFGAALAVYEGTIGTALLDGKHSDATVIWLCVLMALVILAAFVTVGIIAYKRPQHLMLTQQDTIGQDVLIAAKVRKATRVLVESPRPKTPKELLELMDEIESVLAEGER
jgi:hypothetical protein